MSDFGGFEHNLQSLRVVDELEEHYAEFDGLNLTFECREGILKHCSYNNAVQLGELGERFINRAAARARGAARELRRRDRLQQSRRRGRHPRRPHHAWSSCSRCRCSASITPKCCAKYPALAGRRLVYEILRRMINHLVSDLIDSSAARLARVGGAVDRRGAGRIAGR